MFAKKEEHGAYTIKNSMEFYPSQRLSTKSIGKILINVEN
jgi:hypothetical protein